MAGYLDSDGLTYLLTNLKPAMMQVAYPKGIVIFSASAINPAQQYGGTWVLQDTHMFQGWYVYVKTSDYVVISEDDR